MAEKDKNFLDCVPLKNPAYKWEYDESRLVVIEIQNTGVYNRMAQKLFKKPKTTRLSLDLNGSFVWENIDGDKTVGDILQLFKAKFGSEKALERLVQFLRILQNNRFIKMQ